MEQHITKRDKSLGKLNRQAAEAIEEIVTMGHPRKRFKRDYQNCTAIYTCPNCNATATVTAVPQHGESFAHGLALLQTCESYTARLNRIKDYISRVQLEMAA